MRKKRKQRQSEVITKPYDTCTAVSCLTSFVNSSSKLFSERSASLIALSICFKSLSLPLTPLLTDFGSVFTSAWFPRWYWTYFKVFLSLWRGLCEHGSHCKPQKPLLEPAFVMRCEETSISCRNETALHAPLHSWVDLEPGNYQTGSSAKK